MIEQDTIKLLRECDAGVKMGVTSIDDVFEQISKINNIIFPKMLFIRGNSTDTF